VSSRTETASGLKINFVRLRRRRGPPRRHAHRSPHRPPAPRTPRDAADTTHQTVTLWLTGHRSRPATGRDDAPLRGPRPSASRPDCDSACSFFAHRRPYRIYGVHVVKLVVSHY